jgi:hypothetical protein
MFAFLLAKTISCSDALGIINKLSRVVGLTDQQRIEIILVIKQHIPTCPFTVVPDERSKPSF